MAADQFGSATRFHSSRGLQWILAVLFFFLLVFVINAAAGAFWLAQHNLYGDSFIFFMMFGFGAALLLLATLFLFAVSHSEIFVGPDHAVMTLPNWRGPTPMFPYVEVRVPYKDVAAVETRSEVYRYVMMPVIVKAYSIVRRDGRRFTLGYVRENPQDPPIPFNAVAQEIATRAGVPITDRGIVDAGGNVKAMLRDEPAWDAPPIDATRIAAYRSRASIAWRVTLSVLVIAVIAAALYQVTRLLTVS